MVVEKRDNLKKSSLTHTLTHIAFANTHAYIGVVCRFTTSRNKRHLIQLIIHLFPIKLV